MGLISHIQHSAAAALQAVFQASLRPEDIQVSATKPEFEGDYTIVVFPFSKFSKLSADLTATKLGDWLLVRESALFSRFNVIKGFLNLTVHDSYLVRILDPDSSALAKETLKSKSQTVMVEFSSPNTNKPLHLGHLRNNFLGDSVSEILNAGGYQVIRANLVNDRGIHICKSMVAWQKFGQGSTPQSAGMKGDHFVGQYYVRFNDAYKEEVADLVRAGIDEVRAEKEAPLMKATVQMLQLWESGDPETRALWQRMNSWVYVGFEETYLRLGIRFDRMYYESNTYLLGKDIVLEGLEKGIFYKNQDGSIWVDLSADGLDQKLLIRSDGTSVYMTQDLGTAQLKYEDYHMDRSIYVIADEQNYHMKVLKLVLEKLGKPYAPGIRHLSYGMVDLTTGKMKSREGTVVDADDLTNEMIATAASHTEALGKVKDFDEQELQQLYTTIGIGAMKFFLLRVNPQKRMVFDPTESIDFHGFTGPFIQYTYARIKSILRKEGVGPLKKPGIEVVMNVAIPLHPRERAVILILEQYPGILEEACTEMDPSIIAGYLYSLARSFNSLYTELPIARAETMEKKTLRMKIAWLTADIIALGMALLRIDVPERM